MSLARLVPRPFQPPGRIVIACGAAVDGGGTKAETRALLVRLKRMLQGALPGVEVDITAPTSFEWLARELAAPVGEGRTELLIFVGESPAATDGAVARLRNGVEATAADVARFSLAADRVLVWAACHAERIWSALAPSPPRRGAGVIGFEGEVPVEIGCAYLVALVHRFILGSGHRRFRLRTAHFHACRDVRRVLGADPALPAAGAAIQCWSAGGGYYLSHPRWLWRALATLRPRGPLRYVVDWAARAAILAIGLGLIGCLMFLWALAAPPGDPAVIRLSLLKQRRAEGAASTVTYTLPGRIDEPFPVDGAVLEATEAEAVPSLTGPLFERCLRVTLIPSGEAGTRPAVERWGRCAVGTFSGASAVQVPLADAFHGAGASGPYEVGFEATTSTWPIRLRRVTNNAGRMRVQLAGP